MIDISKLGIEKAHSHLVKGDFSAKELAQSYLDSIKKQNGEINAYLEIYDDVLDQAELAQKEINENNLLAGIPIAVKDNILIKGRHASASSKILENYTATYDATVIEKLKKAGSVFLGRTNMDEFAMGGSTETSAFGITKNPHDISRVPGGSSGGSAAAVAMNGALFALGSDTGGSVRQPASFCGCVGLKPTYGAVSRHGLMAMGSSLDVIGPITKTVRDAEIIFNAIRGQDKMDSTTFKDGTFGPSKKNCRVIGIPKEAFEQPGLDPKVKENFEQSIKLLKEKNYEIRDISIPSLKYSLAAYYILMPAEVSTNLARFDGVKYGLHLDGKDLVDDYMKTRSAGFGDEARRRIMLGTYVLSSGYYDAYYNKAITMRNIIKNDFEKVFSEVDAIVMPTSPTPAFKIGEKINDPVSMYLSDIFTVTANITGLPAISIPSGMTQRTDKPLPLGIQFISSHGQEDVLFNIGKSFLNE